MVELKNNANKKPQTKLQPGAIQSLQLFLQNLRRRELLGKMMQHSYALCLNLRKGCSCRRAEQLPACLWKTSCNPSHLPSQKFNFFQEKSHYFRNTNDGHSALVIFHEGIELEFQLRLPHAIKPCSLTGTITSQNTVRPMYFFCCCHDSCAAR